MTDEERRYKDLKREFDNPTTFALTIAEGDKVSKYHFELDESDGHPHWKLVDVEEIGDYTTYIDVMNELTSWTPKFYYQSKREDDT